jgi:hypothetical protein
LDSQILGRFVLDSKGWELALHCIFETEGKEAVRLTRGEKVRRPSRSTRGRWSTVEDVAGEQRRMEVAREKRAREQR